VAVAGALAPDVPEPDVPEPDPAGDPGAPGVVETGVLAVGSEGVVTGGATGVVTVTGGTGVCA
jgi:hypothetical protein